MSFIEMDFQSDFLPPPLPTFSPPPPGWDSMLPDAFQFNVVLAVFTALWFMLIPLPEQMAAFRRHLTGLTIGALLVLYQVWPSVVTAWAASIARLADLYSGICEALNLVDVRHVWLAGTILAIALIAIAVWADMKKSNKPRTKPTGTATPRNHVEVTVQQSEETTRGMWPLTLGKFDELIQRTVDEKVAQALAEQRLTTETPGNDSAVMAAIHELREELKEIRQELVMHGGYVTQQLDAIVVRLNVDKDDEEEPERPRMVVDELDARERRAVDAERAEETHGQGLFSQAYSTGSPCQESPLTAVSGSTSLTVGNRAPPDKSTSSALVGGEDVIEGADANVILVADRGAPRRRTQTTTPIPETRREAIGQAATVEEIQRELKEVKEELKRQKEQAKRLTAEEKDLSVEELRFRKSLERDERRYGPQPLRYLTTEEKEMTWGQIEKRVAQENRERFKRRLEAQGYKVWTCQTCGRHEREGSAAVENHECFRTSYLGPAQRRSGVPIRQQLVATGSGSGLRVQPQPVVDLEQLKRERAEYDKIIARMESHQAAARPGVSFAEPLVGRTHTPPHGTRIETVPPPEEGEIADDVPMTDAANQGVGSAPSSAPDFPSRVP